MAHIDTTELQRIGVRQDGLPLGLVATLPVTYRGPGDGTSQGVIYYAKAQVAQDLDIELRRFAKDDRRFPNYSTGDQFLTVELADGVRVKVQRHTIGAVLPKGTLKNA